MICETIEKIAQTNRKDDFMTRTNNRNKMISLFFLSLHTIWTVNQRSNAHVINTQLSTLIENESSPHQPTIFFPICFHEIYSDSCPISFDIRYLIQFDSFWVCFLYVCATSAAPLHEFWLFTEEKESIFFFFYFRWQ